MNLRKKIDKRLLRIKTKRQNCCHEYLIPETKHIGVLQGLDLVAYH